MAEFEKGGIKMTARIAKLIDDLFADMPHIETDRAVLVTESYKATENLPIIKRRALAFCHILENIPITIRDGELIVGSNAKKPRSCQLFPEYSYEWLESELDTVSTRSADPFFISEEDKESLHGIFPYWKGKTNSDLALSYMAPETLCAMRHNVFTPGNYFYNGIGHITVDYKKILHIGFKGLMREAAEELERCKVYMPEYSKKHEFLESVIICADAAIKYAKRYSELAREMADAEKNSQRKSELEQISRICARVPENGAQSFYEACQTFWFIQMLLQTESSGHSISPGRFDQYMYPFYKKDLEQGRITPEFAQELMDCIWVKFNDLNKVRDAASSEGFAGYSLFQNLCAGGQTPDGLDATNDLSYMCIQASMHTQLPAPSFSVRIWNGTPNEFILKAAELTRTGVGLPAYYNDEIIIPSMMSRGISLEEARDYNIIGCVEPQIAAKTDGWHDAAFFNMCRPVELVFSNGIEDGEAVGLQTGELSDFETFDDFFGAYKKQMAYEIGLLVNADNAIDVAHSERCPLPFESSMVDDCIKRGKSIQEGGAVYNFTGPQGFGIANMTDALYAIKKLVYEDKKYTLYDFKTAMDCNFGEPFSPIAAERAAAMTARRTAQQGRRMSPTEIESLLKAFLNGICSPEEQARFRKMKEDIEALPKYGNDIPEIDLFAREVAYTYTKEVEKYKNPRGGLFQAGLYPVSANVPLGHQTGATPDARLACTPIADGVGPCSGRDTKGPTAAANSVAKLDHAIASNGTLYNQKFHPSALAGMSGLQNFASYIRAFFDQKGMHMQFNVVSRETLIDAQNHPEKYKSLVVRVAGYSALFTTLSRSLQDDIINRTEQAFNR